MYGTQGIFQHHFQCKKVHTILEKIQYLLNGRVDNNTFVSGGCFSNLASLKEGGGNQHLTYELCTDKKVSKLENALAYLKFLIFLKYDKAPYPLI